MHSYKQLPLNIYQQTTKFRDETRPKNGLIRCREFLMKDAYSFDIDEKGMNETYEKMREAYKNIFGIHGVNITYDIVKASSGSIGGNNSEEFIALADIGDDKIIINKNTGEAYNSEIRNEHGEEWTSAQGIEVGHIFKLGDKYSKAMNATFNLNNKATHFQMGCYGIGITRLAAVIVEQNNDDRGIIWPRDIAPYTAVIIPLTKDETLAKSAYDHMNAISRKSNMVLYDDRDKTAGEKLKDADLMGIPFKIIIGNKTPNGMVEVKERLTGKSFYGDPLGAAMAIIGFDSHLASLGLKFRHMQDHNGQDMYLSNQYKNK